MAHGAADRAVTCRSAVVCRSRYVCSRGCPGIGTPSPPRPGPEPGPWWGTTARWSSTDVVEHAGAAPACQHRGPQVIPAPPPGRGAGCDACPRGATFPRKSASPGPTGGSVDPNRGVPIATTRGHCADAHLGCPCRGDETIHEERSREITEARTRSAESVDCPECGSATTPLAILSWGNCRACRTAQSRLTNPLRW
jgi:hypothetical protein